MPARRDRTRVNLNELARALGVHPSTVSRALDPQKRHLIGEEVVRQVEEMADILGYRPDLAAASLRTKRSRLVGALVPDITNPVFSPVIGGLQEELAGGGYSLILSSVADTSQQIGLIAELAARRVDGLILATVSRQDEALTFCIERGVPVVLVNRSETRKLASSVVSDDEAGMRLAAGHLISLGHRRIGHVAGPSSLSTGFQRRIAFEKVMGEHELPVPDETIVQADAFTREAGLIAARVLLAARAKVTAVVAGNDLLALGVYAAAAELGLSCPGDLSITGHNDMPFVDLVTPPLTTIRISHRDMGRRAGQLLLAQIENPDAAIVEVVLEPALVVRGSAAPPHN
jgi:LacI family transcriptional regulator